MGDREERGYGERVPGDVITDRTDHGLVGARTLKPVKEEVRCQDARTV